MKKLLLFFAAFLILATNAKVSAYEIFWYDRYTNFNKFAKIVLFPLSNIWDAPDDYQLGVEGSRNFKFNSYIDDRLSKKLKKVNFIRLADEIHEKSDILTNLYGELLNPFEDEKSRAEAVEKATMADMYIVPRFRENRIQEDISPRREWEIELKSWTEERGGPNGSKTYNRKSRTVHHVINAEKIYLHIMQLEFTGYDKDANKIMTSIQQDRSYGVNEEGQFKDLVERFQKAFLEARDNKKADDKSKRINLGFTPTIFADEHAEDIYFSNAFDYTLQELALKQIKNAGVITNNRNVNFYIRSRVRAGELIPIWHDPSYSVRNYTVHTETRKWYDKDKKEHTMTITDYDQTIDDYLAYWSFYWAVHADFWLVDENNNVIISETYTATDDKPVDAYRHIAEDFCKKVNAVFKE